MWLEKEINVALYEKTIPIFKDKLWYNSNLTYWLLDPGSTLTIPSTVLYVFFVYKGLLRGDLNLWCTRPDPSSNF